MHKKILAYLFGVMTLLIVQSGSTAQLELSVVDDQGHPLQDTVAALIPAQQTDFTV